MSADDNHSIGERPRLSSQALSLLENLRHCCNDPAHQQFIELCGERIGYSVQETRELLVTQVLPFVAMRSDLAGDHAITLVPSAGVSTLLELASIFGPQALRPPCHAAPLTRSDPAQYLQHYAATRSRLITLGFQLSESAWPEPASISLSDTKRYKGCSGSNDNNSTPWSGSSSSSGGNYGSSSTSYSSSSSSSGGGDGSGCLPLLVIGLGYLIYLYPYLSAAAILLIVANVWLARWIPSFLNGLIWATTIGWLAYWGVPHGLPYIPLFLRQTAPPGTIANNDKVVWISTAVAGFVGLLAGYVIGQTRKGRSS